MGEKTSEKPRVVVVGSCNMDMSIHGQTIPRIGETVIGGQFVMAAGGKGANQAIAAARQSAEVFLVSRLGSDVFGKQLLANYREDGICIDHVKVVDDVSTGIALILVDPQGENLISVAAGANQCLTPQDVQDALEAIGQFSVLLLQLEIPMETVITAAKTAKRLGAVVLLDPAPAVNLPAELLPYVDILTPNEIEAAVLTGLEPDGPDFAQHAAACLREKGVANVVITLGAEGCHVVTEDESGFIPAHKVDAKDTTAAGDAFNGALGAAMASGKSLHDAIKDVANAAAALSVTRHGAQPSLPTADDVARFREGLRD
ncbi:MAG: ribokinase [Planctomycetia bacterium]